MTVGSATRERLPVSLLVGVYLFVLGVYLLSGPGRIDVVDGQLRYEVSRNLVASGVPELRDPFLLEKGLRGRGGRVFVGYNAGASLAAVPLVALGESVGDDSGELTRFFFSMTSGFFGAGVAVIVLAWLIDLGVPRRRALAFAALSAFATYIWPVSASTFDQAQHAFLFSLAAWLAWRSGRRGSFGLAVGSGAALGSLVNYQENFVLLWPVLALLTAGESAAWSRSALRRQVGLAAAVAVGGVILLLYNWLRFEAFYFFPRQPAGFEHPPAFGNPVPGVLSLVASPGKSLLLYCPVMFLALAGWRSLRRKDRTLASAVVLASAIQLCFSASLTFFGSDWAWGPRYLAVLIPLWMPAAALWVPGSLAARRLRAAVVAMSVAVQLLGLSIDDHRFFFEHRLTPFFWYEQPWFYFRHSALVSRPGEILRTAEANAEGVAGLPFVGAPYRDTVTYVEMWRPNLVGGMNWIRRFAVYRLPRPWPLWMGALPPPRRPAPWGTAVALCVMSTLIGSLGILRGARLGRGQEVEPPTA